MKGILEISSLNRRKLVKIFLYFRPPNLNFFWLYFGLEGVDKIMIEDAGSSSSPVASQSPQVIEGFLQARTNKLLKENTLMKHRVTHTIVFSTIKKLLLSLGAWKLTKRKQKCIQKWRHLF